MKRIALIALPLICWLGCGGENSSPIESKPDKSALGGSGGGGAGAGSGPAMGGAAAKGGATGAASLVVQNSTSVPVGYGCGTSHTLTWGQLDASGFPSPASALVDGQLGASVQCNLSGEESYAISAQLSANSAYVDIEGSVDSITGAGTTRVSVYDSSLGLVLVDQNCTLQVSGFSQLSGGFSANVSCSQLRSNDDAYLWCALSGTIAFERCEQ